jgi:2-oxoglutarate ferredoxin oxidoreductase subunit beta
MVRALDQYLRDEVQSTPFCPGCGHGILLGLILRTIERMELDMQRMLFVSGIGCAAWIPSPNYKADTLHALHGRAIPFATGARWVNPDLKIVVISGDGDLASIGGNHLIHAARRGHGMTGGQAASTTPEGSLTTTTPAGSEYPPFDLCRLVKAAGAGYVARASILRPYDLMDYLSRALAAKSFSFVEVLSPCPTQYGRRNLLETPASMFDQLQMSCIKRHEIDPSFPMPEGSLTLGEF